MRSAIRPSPSPRINDCITTVKYVRSDNRHYCGKFSPFSDRVNLTADNNRPFCFLVCPHQRAPGVTMDKCTIIIIPMIAHPHFTGVPRRTLMLGERHQQRLTEQACNSSLQLFIFYYAVSISICLSIYLSIIYLSIYLSISFFPLSVSVSLSLSLSRSSALSPFPLCIFTSFSFCVRCLLISFFISLTLHLLSILLPLSAYP